MSVATHRTAIVAMLNTVTNVGAVHDEERYAREQAKFQTLYLWQPPTVPPADPPPKQLRGWFLRRVRTAERTLGVGRVLNVHSWQVRGFMALDSDAGSGKAFDDLIEAIRTAYRTDATLGGAVQPGPLGVAGGMQLTESGPVVFTGVLCHGATLLLDTYEYLDA